MYVSVSSGCQKNISSFHHTNDAPSQSWWMAIMRGSTLAKCYNEMWGPMRSRFNGVSPLPHVVIKRLEEVRSLWGTQLRVKRVVSSTEGGIMFFKTSQMEEKTEWGGITTKMRGWGRGESWASWLAESHSRGEVELTAWSEWPHCPCVWMSFSASCPICTYTHMHTYEVCMQ